eukprot:COSAG01_NODE_74155_length_225_cov_24.515873_1_plen_41_part_01
MGVASKQPISADRSKQPVWSLFVQLRLRIDCGPVGAGGATA